MFYEDDELFNNDMSKEEIDIFVAALKRAKTMLS